MKDRQNELKQLLHRYGYKSVAELAETFGVSVMTIRRDLEKLERDGLVRRTHGGAYVVQETLEIDYQIRETVNIEEKKAIGSRAYSILQPGESIFIDAGTTTFFLALSIDDTKRLTVVTYSLVVAQSLLSKLHIDTILLGGKVHSVTRSLIGPLTEEAVDKFKYSRAFLGASGINCTEGFTASTLEEITIKKQAAVNAREVIVLADSTKLYKSGLAKFLDCNQVNTLVTDWKLKESDRDTLEKLGIKVIIAESA